MFYDNASHPGCDVSRNLQRALTYTGRQLHARQSISIIPTRVLKCC